MTPSEAVSALTGEGLDDLIAAIDLRLADVLDEPRVDGEVTIPFSDGRRRAWLHDLGVVRSEEATEDGQRMFVTWTRRQQSAFEALNGTDRDDADADDDEDDDGPTRTPGGWDPLGRD